LLPSQFWVPHGNPPWRGGIERALMSTTADKSVALHYANGKGTVVEIDVGRIQIGGDVSFLSMVWSALPAPAALALSHPLASPVGTPLIRRALSPHKPRKQQRPGLLGLGSGGCLGWGSTRERRR
jgi:hypothetical protein